LQDVVDVDFYVPREKDYNA